MTLVFSARRPNCTSCLRPQNACICHWVRPTEHQTEVLILQHPLELHEAKGTARLLHLSLAHSRLVTGEQFAEAELRALLTEPFGPQDPQDPPRPARHAVLLYPEAAQDATLGIATAPPLDPAWLQDPARLRLVVLDGTWRKSRRMLHLNPLLQQLPRLALHQLPASRYRIRKARQLHQLSTLEACCAALAKLEDEAERFEPLLLAFDGLVEHLLQARPPQTFS
ncbi:MAG: tRNA-uridine aminocarboxypropyltransferase [Polaromonas sp.]